MLPRSEDGHRETPPHAADRFVTTHWTLVLAAGRRESPEAADALVVSTQTPANAPATALEA